MNSNTMDRNEDRSLDYCAGTLGETRKSNMEFHRLNSAENTLFAEAFTLYQESFPIHEQRFSDKQTALMINPLYHFDIIMDDNIFAGILLHWKISHYSYIEHFAIHSSMRGKSLGSRSLAAFCENHSFVILEIDPPVDEVSIRRESFYQKLGFQKNNYAHLHPAYRKQFPPHELVIMSYPKYMAEQEYQLFRRELSEIVMKDAVI